eukprot:2317051-Rhodomonas_salina.1
MHSDKLLAKKSAVRKSVGAGWNSGEIQPMKQSIQRTSRLREQVQNFARIKNCIAKQRAVCRSAFRGKSLREKGQLSSCQGC